MLLAACNGQWIPGVIPALPASWPRFGEGHRDQTLSWDWHTIYYKGEGHSSQEYGTIGCKAQLI